MIIKNILFLLVFIIATIGLQTTVDATIAQTNIVLKQTAVENGLRHPILLAHHENDRMSLTDRMAYYTARR